MIRQKQKQLSLLGINPEIHPQMRPQQAGIFCYLYSLSMALHVQNGYHLMDDTQCICLLKIFGIKIGYTYNVISTCFRIVEFVLIFEF